MAYVADDNEVLSFNTPKSRKRLAKILAAKLNKTDVSALMNWLLEREINKHFSSSTQRELLSSPAEDEPDSKKVESPGPGAVAKKGTRG